MKPRTPISLVALTLVLSGCAPPGPAPGSWGWKRAPDPDDLLAFLNGTGAYSTPVTDARVSAIWRESRAEFYVVYQHRPPPAPAGGWGWKLATDPDDALAFLNGEGSYDRPVADAQIAALWKGTHAELYIFYRSLAPGESPAGSWGWKRAPDPSDAMAFLNGSGAYSHPVTTARIAAYDVDGRDVFQIFYQRATVGDPVGNWYWKLATTIDDAFDYVNGSGAYSDPLKGLELSGMWKTSHDRFHVFANQGTRVWVQSPLADERFVQGEEVALRALVTSDAPLDGTAVIWTSSVDGVLGTGPVVTASALSLGTHSIEATGYGSSASAPARVFADLGELYMAAPAAAEIDRIQDDFVISLVDGTGVDELWSAYSPVFDQTSTDPSQVVIAAKLDVLRHQRFSQPLPITSGVTMYEHLRTHVGTVTLRLDCGASWGGGGQVSLNRNVSVWDGRSSGTATDPDACKTPFATPSLYPYVSPLYLIVHEGRHNEPGEPGHTSCGGASNRDASLEGGSGHASAAIYTMWVYKYGLYDPPAIKTEARSIAQGLLTNRFCTGPTHSNPLVQAIVDELLAP